MKINQPGVFSPTTDQKHIELFWSDPENKPEKETDHSVYWDSLQELFFVVGSTSLVGGPNVSAFHSIWLIAEYKQKFPGRGELVQKAIHYSAK